jgi:N-methylhydantoinase A
VLSAAGLLAAPVEHEVSVALPRAIDAVDLAEVRATLDQLDGRCRTLMAQENIAAAHVTRLYFADVCYTGQGYHLEVPFEPAAPDPFAALTAAFYSAHDRTYGYAPKSPIRLVNLRAVHSAAGATRLQDEWTPAGRSALVRKARILLPERQSAVEAAVYDRAALKAGDAFSGPAIVEQDDTTTLLTPGWHCRVDALGNLVLERAGN